MRKLVILLSVFIIFSCEDKDDSNDCDSLMAKADELANTFETKSDNDTATKADCDAAVAAMEAAVDCLPPGPEKTETMQMLPVIKAMCSLMSETNTSRSY